jgi:phospholipid/cholesterol/gamma-HCH transport system substrate-binding protein
MRSITERNPIAVGLIGLVVLVVIGLLAFNADNLPVIGGGTTYTAYFTDDAGLTPGNEVRVAGVTVGKVTGAALDDGRVLITFRVKGAWVGNQSSGTSTSRSTRSAPPRRPPARRSRRAGPAHRWT